VQFVNVISEAGITFSYVNGASGRKYMPESMGSGAAFLDYDNDGYLDIATGGPGPAYVFINNRTGDFALSQTWSTATAAYVACADYDNDGYLDLVLFHGQGNPTVNLLFHNNGDSTFTQVGDTVTQTAAQWLAGSWGDYDNDGFLDLWVNECTGQNALYHNVGSANGNSNQWLKFNLVGTASNRSAIGAKVRVKATICGKTFWQLREISGGQWCQNDLRPNFGLGDATKADAVRIEWPSGIVQELGNVTANQILTVTEPARLQMTTLGELEIQCWTGQAFDVQVSADLSAWSTVATVTNTTGDLVYTDPDAGTPARKFYRVVGK